MTNNSPIGIFDSGIGGLSVMSNIVPHSCDGCLYVSLVHIGLYN